MYQLPEPHVKSSGQVVMEARAQSERPSNRTGKGNYLVVISNVGPLYQLMGMAQLRCKLTTTQLPLKLDIYHHNKFSTISWKPIKDLIRNVINKREDGTDIQPQEGNPGTVHVWPEKDGQCGYAMGTLQKRKHALRVLCKSRLSAHAITHTFPSDWLSDWLGGNIWHGRTLFVMLYHDGVDGVRYVDSRWINNSGRPMRLESLVSVSQKGLLQHQPSFGGAKLMSGMAKGSMYPRILGGTQDEDNKSVSTTVSWSTQPRSASRDFSIYPSGTSWLGSGTLTPPYPYSTSVPQAFNCDHPYYPTVPYDWRADYQGTWTHRSQFLNQYSEQHLSYTALPLETTHAYPHAPSAPNVLTGNQPSLLEPTTHASVSYNSDPPLFQQTPRDVFSTDGTDRQKPHGPVIVDGSTMDGLR